MGVVQPNYGFNHACGATENEVEFMPDIGSNIAFDWNGMHVDGGLFKQSYQLHGGNKLGSYLDGQTAVVQNKWGKGQIMLIGTYPSEGYHRKQSLENRNFFSSLLGWAGKEQLVKVSNTKIQVRLRKSENRIYLWAINPSEEWQETEITLSGVIVQGIQKLLWGENTPDINNGRILISIPPKDVIVVEID